MFKNVNKLKHNCTSILFTYKNHIVAQKNSANKKPQQKTPNKNI